MKKEYLLLGVSFIALAVVVLLSFVVLGNSQQVEELQKQSLRGFDSGAPLIFSPTVATSSCASPSSTAGTLLLATGTARTSFLVSNTDTSGVYICRSASCVRPRGLPLAPTSTFEQSDTYIGPYSCVGSTVTSTVAIQYTQ